MFTRAPAGSNECTHWSIWQTVSSKTRMVFVNKLEVRMFSTDWSKDPSLWIKLSGLEKRKTKRAFSSTIYKQKEPTLARSRRSAIAPSLSLAMLLGLPAQTGAGIARWRLIVDAGCGKDMVGVQMFIESFCELIQRNDRTHCACRLQTPSLL